MTMAMPNLFLARSSVGECQVHWQAGCPPRPLFDCSSPRAPSCMWLHCLCESGRCCHHLIFRYRSVFWLRRSHGCTMLFSVASGLWQVSPAGHARMPTGRNLAEGAPRPCHRLSDEDVRQHGLELPSGQKFSPMNARAQAHPRQRKSCSVIRPRLQRAHHCAGPGPGGPACSGRPGRALRATAEPPLQAGIRVDTSYSSGSRGNCASPSPRHLLCRRWHTVSPLAVQRPRVCVISERGNG